MNALAAFRQRFRSWGRRHSYSFFSSLGSMLGHRVGTLMTVVVLGIGILLPLGLYVTLDNLNRLDLKQEEWGSVSVFVEASNPVERVTEFANSLSERADISEVVIISPEQGMAEFSANSGFGRSLELLGENPLPWVLTVRPMLESDRGMPIEQRVVQLAEEFRSMALVSSVQFDHKWLQRLGRLLDLGRAGVMILGLLFGIAVVVVVANTIRLDVAARSEEIEILALVGAGNSFIRQPFLYSGLWYGLMGGILALALMELCLAYLGGPLSRLLDAYGQQYGLDGLDLAGSAYLLAGSSTLGLLGAYMAVQRYLKIMAMGGTLGRR